MSTAFLIMILSLSKLCYATENAEFSAAISVDEAVASGMVSAERVPLLVVVDGNSAVLEQVVQHVVRDCERTGQCVVTLQHHASPTTIDDVRKVLDAGYAFVLYLQMADGDAIRGRLYNTLDVTMLEGKRWSRRDTITEWAHVIATDLWKQLMGNPGSFTASLVYVQRKSVGRRAKSIIWATDWDGKNPRVVVTRQTILVSPAWHKDQVTQRELIFFSEFTSNNVRLMATDLAGRVTAVLDREGTMAGVSHDPQSNKVVYGWSGDIWEYRHDGETQKGEHRRLIHESEPSACPTLLRNGDIIYCGQGRIKRWSAATHTTQTLTSGFATAPSCQEDADILVYSKRVNGKMQLFSYPFSQRREKQLTFGESDHIDPSVSPCGNFVAFCTTDGKKSEIDMLNIVTGEIQHISPHGQSCSCPTWSPIRA